MRKRFGKTAGLTAVLAAAALFVSGCGGSAHNSSSADYTGTEASYDDSYDITEEAEDVGTADYDLYAEPQAAYDEDWSGNDGETEETPKASADTQGTENADGTETSGDAEDAAQAETQEAEEKLVYTCSLTMQTLTYEETVRNIRTRIKEAGGIIESEDETNSDTYWYENGHYKTSGKMRLYITVRIPTKQYESFLSSLEGEGKIMNKNSSVENISRKYRDTQVIIRNLEIQEERLQEMMDKAETIEEMITVEDRLTEVQTELDQRRTQLSVMDTDVALSTVNLTVEEVVQYTPEPVKTDTFADRLKSALSGSAENFRNLLETILFAVIYLLPIAAVVLAVFLIVRAIHRAYRKKHPKAPRAPRPPKQPWQGRRNAQMPQGGAMSPGPAGPAGYYQGPGMPPMGPGPEYGVPGSSAPGRPEYGVPGSSAPEYGVPGSSAPEYGVPGNSAPEYGVPGNSAPERPEYGVPGSSAPEYGTPVNSSPEHSEAGMPLYSPQEPENTPSEEIKNPEPKEE